jgi:hypothetical protein
MSAANFNVNVNANVSTDNKLHRHQTHNSKAYSANDDLFAELDWEDAQEEGGDGPVRLTVLYPPDLREVLSRIEDLWMRIKRNPGFHVHIANDRELDTHLVLIRPDKSKLDDEDTELLQAVQDMGTYAWTQLQDAQGNETSQPHTLVSDISWAGEVLTIELTPLKRLIRQSGLDVEWQLQGLVNRVQMQPLTSVPAVHQHAEPPQTERWQTIMRDLKQEMDALDV